MFRKEPEKNFWWGLLLLTPTTHPNSFKFVEDMYSLMFVVQAKIEYKKACEKEAYEKQQVGILGCLGASAGPGCPSACLAPIPAQLATAPHGVRAPGQGLTPQLARAAKPLLI